jgi:hypothetical protein
MLVIYIKVYNVDLRCIETYDMAEKRPVVHLLNTTTKGGKKIG